MNKILKNETAETTTTAERFYFPELDGLRFFAFALVFIHHTLLFSQVPFLSVLHTNGWIGVDLFFVLSAYLFTKLLVEENRKTQTISFKKFYIRRIFRIWPIYFLFIIFSITCFIFLQHGTITRYVGIRLAGLFSFTDNIMAAFKGFSSLPFTSHLWTISYEEQFYVFIPIIILLLARSSSRTKQVFFISTFILFTAIRFVLIAYNMPHPAVWVLPVTHFESIVLGIAIGFGGLDFLLKRIHPVILVFGSIVFFILLCQLPNVKTISYWLMLTYPLVGISTSLVLYSVLKSEYLKAFFSKKIFVFLGKRSYGLYVYHLLGTTVAGFAVKQTGLIEFQSLAVFLFSLGLTILIAVISYALIEKPFLVLKKKFEVIASRPV